MTLEMVFGVHGEKMKAAGQKLFYEIEFGAKYASTQKTSYFALCAMGNPGWVEKALLRIAFSNVKYHINIKYSVQIFDSVIKAVFPNF